MNTHERMLTQMNSFFFRAGKPPNAVYIGQYEIRELHHLAKPLEVYTGAKYPEKRDEWNGMPVYVVDAESHIAFA